ncbi:MAG: DUF1295 domain-containing protein [Actinomycetes bacterium]
MRSATRVAVLTTIVAVALAGVVAVAAADHGARIGGVPVVMWCAALSFAVNWVAFVPSWFRRTERFYDLTGSITYLTVTTVALVATGRFDARSLLLAALVGVWTLRLGSFLFRRVIAAGSDGRFDTIKNDPSRLFTTWTLQGLWVFLTVCAALAAVTAERPTPLSVGAWVGAAIWLIGFSVEVVADRQKRAFRADPANDGGFIRTGLWAWSRHPNYFGEIVLWVGVAVAAAGGLTGSQWVTVAVSPLFVTALLTKVSGIPLLERRADERWGLDDDYEAYKAATPMLIPRPPRRS